MQLRIMAHVELIIAALVISYVFVLYRKNLEVFMSVEMPARTVSQQPQP